MVWKRAAGAVVVVAAVAWAGVAVGQGTGGSANRSLAPAPAPTSRALGGGTSQAELVPIAPCRIIDTRSGGGPLAVGGSRAFDVRGSGGTFAAQGGRTNGCAIPDSATAVEATVTAIASGSGFLRVWPADEGTPNATFLNYDDAINLTNTGTVALCEASCANQDLRARAFGSATHIVVEVSGYYAPPLSAHVENDGSLGRNSRAVATVDTGTSAVIVRFDRPVDSCTYQATVGNTVDGIADGFATAQPEANEPTGVYVETFGFDGIPDTRPFYLTVTC